jgi:hypothetical protein
MDAPDWHNASERVATSTIALRDLLLRTKESPSLKRVSKLIASVVIPIQQVPVMAKVSAHGRDSLAARRRLSRGRNSDLSTILRRSCQCPLCNGLLTASTRSSPWWRREKQAKSS